MQTKLSAKGQVVIPKDVRDRMRLEVGEAFDVIDRNDEVVLRRRKRHARSARDEVARTVQDIRSFYRYDGPALSDEAIARAARDGAINSYRDAERKN
jgi:AbrB family looped-hinge helix DNA binding protein